MNFTFRKEEEKLYLIWYFTTKKRTHKKVNDNVTSLYYKTIFNPFFFTLLHPKLLKYIKTESYHGRKFLQELKFRDFTSINRSFSFRFHCLPFEPWNLWSLIFEIVSNLFWTQRTAIRQKMILSLAKTC